DRVLVAEVVPGTPGVEELVEEVVRVGDVGEPGVEEYGERPRGQLSRERRPVGQVPELAADTDRGQRLAEGFVLAEHPGRSDARPEHHDGQATTAGIPGLGEQFARPGRIVLVSTQAGIEALRPGRKDAAGRGEPPQHYLPQQALAVDGVNDR